MCADRILCGKCERTFLNIHIVRIDLVSLSCSFFSFESNACVGHTISMYVDEFQCRIFAVQPVKGYFLTTEAKQLYATHNCSVARKRVFFDHFEMMYIQCCDRQSIPIFQNDT